MDKDKKLINRQIIDKISTIIAILLVVYYPDDIFPRIVAAIIIGIFNILITPMKGNNLFVLSIVSCILFVSMPYFLTFDTCANWLSDFLSELKIVEYKSTYIETIGSFLGSFLAITGALWLENRMKRDREKSDDSINARIAYYNLEIAFKQVRKILIDSNGHKRNIASVDKFKNFEKFHKLIQDFAIFTDDDWMRNVASLPESCINAFEREHVYLLYNYICRIKVALEKCPEVFNANKTIQYESAYKIMYDFLFIAPNEYRPVFDDVYTVSDDHKDQRNTTNNVRNALRKQAKIHEDIKLPNKRRY